MNASTAAVYRAFMVLTLLGCVASLLALLWLPNEWLRLLVVAAVLFLVSAVLGFYADERERGIG